jgi:hypothetical protein
MKTSTNDEIIKEVKKSISLYHCSIQRYRQLKSSLSRRDPKLVGDALLSCWAELVNSDAGTMFAPQVFVASLLFALNPTTSQTLGEILSGIAGWNLSVEEFPWYLAQQFGKEQVLQELGVLESKRPADEGFSRAANAVQYWLKRMR